MPLRQEFLSKKVEIEKATSNLLKKYERRSLQRNILKDESDESSDEAKPLTLNKKFELQYANDLQNLKAECDVSSNDDKSETAAQLCKAQPDFSSLSTQSLRSSNKNLYDVLTFLEHHLFKILHTKVSAHPNGFFAENIPVWYKKTFDKEIDPNWLNILKKSQQFYIENIQNKIVLYVKDDEDEAVSDIDINSAGDIGKNSKTKTTLDNENKGNEMSVDFVRYKHLGKSLQDYVNYPNRKPISKNVERNIAIKPNNKFNVAKKSVRK